MFNQANVNLITIIIIAMGFIFLGGTFFYKHLSSPIHERQPIYWALGISLASGGGSLLIKLILKNLLPYDILNEMNNIKSNKV